LYEFSKVMSLVDEANAIDEEKLEENAKSFFLTMSEGVSAKNTQSDEVENTSSPEPASDSE